MQWSPLHHLNPTLSSLPASLPVVDLGPPFSHPHPSFLPPSLPFSPFSLPVVDLGPPWPLGEALVECELVEQSPQQPQQRCKSSILPPETRVCLNPERGLPSGPTGNLFAQCSASHVLTGSVIGSWRSVVPAFYYEVSLPLPPSLCFGCSVGASRASLSTTKSPCLKPQACVLCFGCTVGAGRASLSITKSPCL